VECAGCSKSGSGGLFLPIFFADGRKDALFLRPRGPPQPPPPRQRPRPLKPTTYRAPVPKFVCLRLGRLQTAHGTRVTHRRDARLEAGRVQFGHRGARSQPGFECLTAHRSAEPIFGFINECGLVSDGAPFAHPACRVCGIGFVSFNKFSSGKNLNCQCEPVTVRVAIQAPRNG
jgi:hypothetical protein